MTALSAVVVTAAGCVYFNRLYNANRLFEMGRREIEAGRVGSGQANLAEAIEKAERVVREHPNSRWADDALRLIVQARILRQEWPAAAERGEQLLDYAKSPRDSAKVAGYLGIANLNLGAIAPADSLLSVALASDLDETTRANLHLNRGRARIALGRSEEAEADLTAALELRPDWVEPRLELVRLLAATGSGERTAAETQRLLRQPLNAAEQAAVRNLTQYLASTSPAVAVDALADVENSSLLRDERAQLIKLRGDLKIELGRVEEGLADYDLVSSSAPESRAAVEAQTAVIARQVRRATVPGELEGPLADMMRIHLIPAARTSPEAGRLRDMLIRMDFWVETGGLGYVAAAEAARDELHAPALARNLFLRYAEEEPNALWAPKAILAALDLSGLDSRGPDPEQLRRRLLEDYSDSGYVQAMTGGNDPRFTFEDLEQGLQRQLERMKRLADEEVRNRTAERSRRR
ncbi:MAG: outer membrane protein assembly factor BamD [Gemmatimonadetes bacterium]|uniref:Outer membrane protein assembly factor BamD n=1 Tax=Candidatus Kutchimonas denitrificans TaxID=3056748 RepID=A0AAE4Z979_9BACT|nr:outer membrane protein assembly factor BamD [Gemmatimonadota bacterium]NIR75358.1 outer membrane protein assembly factor BamD [Candidatus Kutchimonas denitrificans]NIS01000.1 outer membrane protein assembly factor BamD [Gemmatimonadota bacterium]NIT66624.1 outer membrane protein assembly factor BamD [Gemmatimonadota bacterium]NIU53204.1 hypothetical protein [Gemmatimonadota bacterium]